MECGEVFVVIDYSSRNSAQHVQRRRGNIPAKKSSGGMVREVNSGEEMYGDK